MPKTVKELQTYVKLRQDAVKSAQARVKRAKDGIKRTQERLIRARQMRDKANAALKKAKGREAKAKARARVMKARERVELQRVQLKAGKETLKMRSERVTAAKERLTKAREKLRTTKLKKSTKQIKKLSSAIKKASAKKAPAKKNPKDVTHLFPTLKVLAAGKTTKMLPGKTALEIGKFLDDMLPGKCMLLQTKLIDGKRALMLSKGAPALIKMLKASGYKTPTKASSTKKRVVKRKRVVKNPVKRGKKVQRKRAIPGGEMTKKALKKVADEFKVLRAKAAKKYPDVALARLEADPEVHDSPRHFARATLDKEGPLVQVSPKIAKLPKTQRDGIGAHEIGHLIVMLYEIPCRRGYDAQERKADEIAEEVFGEKIYYTKNPRVQCMGRGAKGTRPRPKGLR